MKLGVNLDHIATLRQLRGTPYPDLLQAARIVEQAGARQITVHLREDRRHIQDADVSLLRKKLRVPLNLEMAVADEIVTIAVKLRPAWACLVPEKRQEVTTEGGLDLKKNFRRIAGAIKRLKRAGSRISLFIEPSLEAVRLSSKLGADAVEFHTGRYCNIIQANGNKPSKASDAELQRLKAASLAAVSLGVHAHAGHGLDYLNVKAVAKLRGPSHKPLIEEFNIGHSIICRAAIVGLDKATREMIAAIRGK
jgi:pyridoxine 5-phosphate synthase